MKKLYFLLFFVFPTALHAQSRRTIERLIDAQGLSMQGANVKMSASSSKC